MEFTRVRLMEHLAVDCPLSLREFCDAMQRRFGLPDFEYDFENETEWGLIVVNPLALGDDQGTIYLWSVAKLLAREDE